MPTLSADIPRASLSSVTTPDQQKRLFIDPRMIPLLAGRRIVLIDDVISSGVSMLAGIALLEMCSRETGRTGHRHAAIGALGRAPGGLGHRVGAALTRPDRRVTVALIRADVR
jgi:hypothetical protein